MHSFTIFEHTIKLAAEPFANLKYRERSVLILMRNSQGEFIFERAHNYYPEGIVRLLGGGVEPGENVVDAAVREMKEETGIRIGRNDLDELVQINVEGVYKSAKYCTAIFVFFLKSAHDNFNAGHHAADIVFYTEDEIRTLITRYFQLRNDNVFPEGDSICSWGDYGSVYGFVHHVALNEFLRRGYNRVPDKIIKK